MSKTGKMRLEAIVASPPTAKCKVIIAMLEKAVSAHPDVLVLDIYFAGEAPGTEPTKGYQNTGKIKRVPSVFVNGKRIAEAAVPDQAVLDAEITAALEGGSQTWLD